MTSTALRVTALMMMALLSSTNAGPALRGLTQDSTMAITDNWRDELLAAVNTERAKENLPALCINDKLNTAAQRHSHDMASNNIFGHVGSSGSTLTTRLASVDFHWSREAENVAAGQNSVTDVMSTRMGSPGHRANILGDYQFFGAGLAENEGGSEYSVFLTQTFGRSETETCGCILK